MSLNPDQFKDHIGPFFHGTDLDSVIGIFTDGFSASTPRNGQHSGSGVYLARTPQRAREFGDYVVRAYLTPDTDIASRGHHSAFMNEVASGFHQPQGDSGAEQYDNWLRANGYHGHEDPDEPSDIIVKSTHRIIPEDFEGGN